MIKAFHSILIFVFAVLSSQGQSQLTNHLNDQKINSIFSDDKSNLFIVGSDTTYFFDGINFLHSGQSFKSDTSLVVAIEKKLSATNDFDLLGTVTTAASLDNQRIIFTNNTSRLYQLYQDKILKYLIPDLGEENLIINKLISAGDYLLICTLNDGLYVWKHKEFVLDKLNYSQGLSNNNVNDAFLDDWGNLWIATDFGLKQLIYIDKSRSSVPNVTIDKINLHYDEVTKEEVITLREAENSLQFSFSGRDYSGERITFEYRLGEKYDWKEADGGQVAISNLLPGNYTFELRASNGNGLYGYAEPIKFSIQATIFTSLWKYLFGGVGLLGLLWVWSLSRYNKSINKFETERNKLKLENDLLKTEQKALQLQMNPHFVFNALNSIQGLIAMNENKAARNYLNKFSTMMRSMLEQSRGDAIEIDKEIKYLDDYLSLERMGREEKFDFTINKSELVNDVNVPSMLIQPFIENSIVHGMKGLEKKGMISVNFKMEMDRLICEIDDNGVGRRVNNSDKEHQSLGMQVVKDRLSKYSKFKSYEHLQIIDKKDDDGASAGTKVIINLPQL